MKKMYPHAETRAKFKYPSGGLMQLRSIVTYDELRLPTMLDANGEACLIVVKNGATTGVTLGRATGIESFVREYKDNAIHSTSRAIAVYSYSNRDGAFSAPGDSGSVVGDANYGIVGMITGGAGKNQLTSLMCRHMPPSTSVSSRPSPSLTSSRSPTRPRPRSPHRQRQRRWGRCLCPATPTCSWRFHAQGFR